MLKQTENTVKIEGILSEVDLKKSSFKKDGVDTNSIGGIIKIRVTQKINGVDTDLEIPVHMFATEFTKKGTSNPAYESIANVMNDYTSIAASDLDHADRVRINNGQIQMNEYYGQNGQLVSFPRVSASFVTRIKKEDCKPEASFNATFMIGNKGFELDKDGVETDKYKITGMLPGFGGKVDVIPFIAINKGVIDNVSQYWNPGDTVKACGKLNFTSRTETTTTQVDFGEPTEKTHTITVSELIITGGSQAPLDGEYAIDEGEVKVALQERQARLAALKEKSANTQKGSSGKAPVGGNKFAGLGF